MVKHLGKGKMKKSIVIALTLFLVLVIVGYLLVSNQSSSKKVIEQNESTGGNEAVISDTPYKTTLVGKYICLPHKDTSGPQTMECAFGLQTDDGLYYALDMSAISLPMGEIQTNDRISVGGLFVPIEQISTDHWQKYDIKGIMKVEQMEKL